MNKTKRSIALFCILLIVSISSVFAKEISLSYDANGNLIQDDGLYYEYNSFNNLIKVREDNSNGRVIAEYFYDDTGNRVKKIEYPSGGGQIKTYYVNSNFVRVVDSSGTHDTIYYYDDTNLVGRKDPDGSKYFYHPDHLGSTNIVTDQYGSTVEETEYTPFGETIQGGESRYLFTGQEKDKETDLMYYGARYYSPYFKRFTQPDTIISDIYDPQSLNRYSYVRNNPLKYTDPSGHFVLSATAFTILTIVATTVAATAAGYAFGYTAGTVIDSGAQVVQNFQSQETGTFTEKTSAAFNDINWNQAHGTGKGVGTASAVAFGTQGLLDSVSLNAGGLFNTKPKTDFYVTQKGTAVHNSDIKGYRYMSTKEGESAIKSGLLRKEGMHVSTSKFSNSKGAMSKMQISSEWSDVKYRGEFNMLKYADNMKVPISRRTGLAESITSSYPEFGIGGSKQFITDDVLQFNNIKKLR